MRAIPQEENRPFKIELMRNMVPTSPFHQSVATQWLSSLRSDTSLSAEERLGEFIVSYEAHPHLGQPALVYLEELLLNDLEQHMQPEITGKAFVFLRMDGRHPDIRRAACNAILASDRHSFSAIPEEAAGELLQIGLDQHNPQVSQAGINRLSCLSAPHLRRIYNSLNAYGAEAQDLRPILRAHYLTAFDRLLVREPVHARLEYEQLQSLEHAPYYICDHTLLATRVGKRLIPYDISMAVTHCAEDILRDQDTRCRRARLAIHQESARLQSPELQLAFLGKLHQKLMHERDLVRLSGAALIPLCESLPQHQKTELRLSWLNDETLQHVLKEPVAAPIVPPREAFARLAACKRWVQQQVKSLFHP